MLLLLCSKKNKKEGSNSSSRNVVDADKEGKGHVGWEKQKTNASKYSYKCLAVTTNALPSMNSLHLLTKMLRKQWEYAFLANFRSMFLIFVTPSERPWMLTTPTNVWRSPCDHCQLVANCICKPIRNHIHVGVRAALPSKPSVIYQIISLRGMLSLNALFGF